MSSAIPRRLAVAFALGGLACSCEAPKPKPDLLTPTEEPSKLRSYQSRTFDVADRLTALRTVMDVLQDLGFIIERANEPLGLVSAARFAEPNYDDVMSVTVTVRQAGEGRFTIRANAVHDNRPVTDPEPYTRFFAAIERSFVLTRQ